MRTTARMVNQRPFCKVLQVDVVMYDKIIIVRNDHAMVTINVCGVRPA